MAQAAQNVKLDILDADGNIIRSYANTDQPEAIDSTSLPHPTYWIRPEQSLSATAGHHRFVWDLRYEPPRSADRDFSIAAVYKRTPSEPHGPFVHPGTYTVRLTVDGKVQEQTIEVQLDPRVEISEEDLQLQTNYSLACYEVYERLQVLRDAIDQKLSSNVTDAQRNALQNLRGNGGAGSGDFLYGSIYETPAERENVVALQQKFLYLLNVLQSADARPTPQAMEGIQRLQETRSVLEKRWKQMN